jgi:hypothetical protein
MKNRKTDKEGFSMEKIVDKPMDFEIRRYYCYFDLTLVYVSYASWF